MARAAWWAAKLRQNVERDRDTNTRLTDAGWTVLRFWEHEDMTQVAIEVRRTYELLRVIGQRQ